MDICEKLEEWAAYLEQAPARAEQAAKADGMDYPYQAGHLKAVCTWVAEEMRKAIEREKENAPALLAQ